MKALFEVKFPQDREVLGGVVGSREHGETGGNPGRQSRAAIQGGITELFRDYLQSAKLKQNLSIWDALLDCVTGCSTDRLTSNLTQFLPFNDTLE